MTENKIVLHQGKGHGHGRGGPRPALTAEQRKRALDQINAAPRGQKKKVAKEIAAMLGVHVNTLTYKLKKDGAGSDHPAPGLHAASGEQPDYNMQPEDTQQDGAA